MDINSLSLVMTNNSLLAYDLSPINITQRIIDANPNVTDLSTIWKDYGTISPNSTEGLKVASLTKRSLQKRAPTTGNIAFTLGIGSARVNLGAYFFTNLNYSVTASYSIDSLLIENTYYSQCSNYGASSSGCFFVPSCSCISSISCVKTCTGLSRLESYSILFLRYNTPSASLTGNYSYTDAPTSSTSNPAISAVVSTIMTIYIAVPIIIFGVIIGSIIWCIWRSRRNRIAGTVVVVQQPQMQQDYYKPHPGYNPVGQPPPPYYAQTIPPTVLYNQQPGQVNYNQNMPPGHYNQQAGYGTQGYGNTRIDQTKPLDPNDYQ